MRLLAVDRCGHGLFGHYRMAGERGLFDFIDQNQLRTGTGAISPSQVAAINDAGGNQEVENQTINRYITLGLSYSPSADWNYRLLLPYIDRSHTTYGAAIQPPHPGPAKRCDRRQPG